MKKNNRFNLNFINQYRSYFFLAAILIAGLFAKKFYTAYNIRAVTGNGSLVMWLGLGFTVCLIAGHMDLTAMHMSTMGALLCLGLHTQSDLPWWAAISIATAAGALVGFINGTLSTRFEIPSFIATLGMQFVLKGLMYIYTGGAEISIGRDYAFNEALTAAVGPLPLSLYFVITTVVTFIVWIFLRFTRTGRNIYMVGANVETAWLAGIKSNAVTTLAFVLSSVCCALGGALNGIYSGAASVTMGEKGISPLMIALTATIIGGTSLSGGKGSVIWTYVSLIAISFLKSLFKKTEYQVLVIAAILIVCIVYETLAKYRRDKMVGTRPNLHIEHLKSIGRM